MQRRQLGLRASIGPSSLSSISCLIACSQPGAPGAALEVLDFAFELLDAILRGSELY